MDTAESEDERSRVLRYWWMAELFSPQRVPNLTRRATRPPDRQVIEWRSGQPLPWEELTPPPPIRGTRRVWRHTVYLGVYDLQAIYESLHRMFGEDTETYDVPPAGNSACAGPLVDDEGRLVADSAVLSSALWAIGRIHDPGPGNPQWMEGFDRAAQEFIDQVDDHEYQRRAEIDTEPLPQDEDSLYNLVQTAHHTAGVIGATELATARIVIESRAVSERRTEESTDTDFLNSLYLDDLAAVGNEITQDNLGPALAAYLTGDDALTTGDRVDVIDDPDAVDAGTGVARLPRGHWPTKPEHSLALSQQFAVNEALNDLWASPGLMGVNGPPGTGKTTMLRDILAGNVVERARRLAVLKKPQNAFTEDAHRWNAPDGYPRSVRQLRPELTGFEMVVASANNGAVENITNEIPAQDAIDQRWHEVADYFGPIATEILRKASHDDGSETTDPVTAWGLVAARLGNKRNRSTFHSAFWFDDKHPKTGGPVGPPRMQTLLKQWRDGMPPRTWTQARDAFNRAERRVDDLIAQRQQAQERLEQLPQLTERERNLTTTLDDLGGHLQQVEHDLGEHAAVEQQTETERVQAAAQYERHRAAKPGVLEIIFSFGRAVRDWREGLAGYAQTLDAAEQRRRQAVTAGDELRAGHEAMRQRLSAAEEELAEVRKNKQDVAAACSEDADRYGDAYPGQEWFGDRRELHAPWLDAELDTARSELFLAALELHRDFLANAAGDMLTGLRAAGDVVAGNYPRHLEANKLRAAWQLFFLAVPLVSTTFASASRLFGGIGREAIGWLMIDEAGQAPPQYAVGAMWRARRVLAVGDPLQIQPVVTIPRKAQHDIAHHYGVSSTWIPPRASVQTLADRATTYGTTLHQGEEPVWVSAPLRVHRRCDEPMFSLCNQIAYNGIMVNGVHRDLADPDRPDRFDRPSSPLIAASHWAHEPAKNSGSHVQPNQIQRATGALVYLEVQGIDASEIIVISPFREVADRLDNLRAEYPGLRSGTIHTAQGREAPVVILVLGGDPDKAGARSWWSLTPNLVNVAASRAQRRLYVIGDQKAWAQHNYFRQLSQKLGAH